MKIDPLNDRIILRREKAPEKSAGGLWLPDNAKEKPLEATVVACGPGAWVDGRRREPSVKRGDKVLVGKYSGFEIVIDGIEHLAVREDDIVGVIS